MLAALLDWIHKPAERTTGIVAPPGAAAFSAFLATAIALLFAAVLLGWETFYFRDFGYFGYPVAHYHRESFWRGEIPLWNPLSSTGLPFLAQWNTLVLYPGSLLYLLFPLPWSLNFYCLAHQFLAGVGMYCLAYCWVNNRLAAAVAGVAFAFNGLTLNCLMWPNNIAALGWMPWVILCVERARQTGGKWVLVAAMVGALQMLAGAPEVISLTWFTAAALWLGSLASAFRTSENRGLPPHAPAEKQAVGPSSAHVIRFLGVVVLVSGLCAAQLLPFFELLRACDRTPAFAGNYWAMPPWGWANLLLPLYGTYRSPVEVCFQPGQEWTSSYYPGVGVVALAILGAWRGGSRRAALLLILAALGLMLALGDSGFLYGWMRKAVPLAAFMRFPIKFVVLAIFCFPLLAAYGVRWLAARGCGPELRARVASVLYVWLALVAIAVTVTFVHPLTYPKGISSIWHCAGRMTFLTLTLVAVVALSRLGTAPQRLLAGLSLVGLVWLDVVSHAPRQNPTVPPSVAAPGLLPSLGKLQPLPRAGESRAFVTRAAHDQVYAAMVTDPAKDYLCHRAWLFGGANLLDGIPIIDGFFSLYLPEQREVWSRLFLAGTNQDLTALGRFLGVSQVTSATNLFEWEARTDHLPLVTAGQQPIFADRETTLRGLTSSNFDPATTVYLPIETRASVRSTNQAPVSVSAVRFRAQRLEFDVNAKGPGLVVVAQSHYAAWKAWVNDEPTPVLVANLAFQALEVPAGTSRVRLVYQDRAFRAGVALSLATAGLLLIAWARSGRPPVESLVAGH